MEWKNLYRGFFMGISDLIPGVSGGTIALLLGIYDQLLKSISGFFSREWKKHIGFLLPLAIGMGGTLISFSKVIEYLLINYYEPTQFFFLGLIVGVLPFISKQAKARENFKLGHILLLVIVGGGLAATELITPQNTAPIETLTSSNVLGLFLAGWAGSMAMLLPGISGSMILLLLGVYWTAIGALSNFNIPIIIVIGSGVVVGFIVSSKIITYLLAHFKHVTFALIMGLVLGSIAVVFPGFPDDGTLLMMSILSFFIGLLAASLANSTNKDFV